MVSMLASFFESLTWVNGLTDATMHQDSNKLVISIKWKMAISKDDWKE